MLGPKTVGNGCLWFKLPRWCFVSVAEQTEMVLKLLGRNWGGADPRRWGSFQALSCISSAAQARSPPGQPPLLGLTSLASGCLPYSLRQASWVGICQCAECGCLRSWGRAAGCCHLPSVTKQAAESLRLGFSMAIPGGECQAARTGSSPPRFGLDQGLQKVLELFGPRKPTVALLGRSSFIMQSSRAEKRKSGNLRHFKETSLMRKLTSNN